MAGSKDKTPAEKKAWEESDERKKALESIADEDERKAADEWDRAATVKSRLSKAREDYEKTSETKNKTRSGGNPWRD